MVSSTKTCCRVAAMSRSRFDRFDDRPGQSGKWPTMSSSESGNHTPDWPAGNPRTCGSPALMQIVDEDSHDDDDDDAFVSFLSIMSPNVVRTPCTCLNKAGV